METIEVIVVDDKSDKQISKYKELLSDKRYERVIFLENNTSKKGAGTCRNIGLSFSSGKWVLFADADDYFYKGFYFVLEKYFFSEYEVIFFTPSSIYAGTNEIANRHVIYEKLIQNYSIRKDFYSELNLRYLFRTPCSKMIKREMLINNDIVFDEVLVCNDDMFSVKVGHFMKKFTVSLEKIYCITAQKNSLSSKRGKEFFYSCLDVQIRVDNFLKKTLK